MTHDTDKNPLSEATIQLRQELFSESQLGLDFLVLTLSSCIIATLGLVMNSAAVIIGAMIIAPLMLPLRGMALGALEGDGELLRYSLITLSMGTMVAVLMSGLVGGIVSVPASSFGSEILNRTQPNLTDLMVAIAAGGISGFAKIRRQLSDALAGTAIAVALMPPLCVVGISLSQGYWSASGGAFLLYLTNLLGITLACLLVFVWGGYAVDPKRMRWALGWFSGLTAILVIPLFISLSNFIRQRHIEAAIKQSLRQETITVGQQTNLIFLEMYWNPFPWQKTVPTIVLTVEANEPVTPTQVRLVEKFLRERFDQPFRLVFRVSQFQEVTSTEKKNPELEPSPGIAPPFQPVVPPSPNFPVIPKVSPSPSPEPLDN